MGRKQRTKRLESHKDSSVQTTLPFIEHLYELRRRLFYVAVSIGIWSIGAYVIEHKLITWLLRPSKGQNFIYTSPLGGIDFLFRLSLYVGVIFSIPVIVYQILRYIEPLINKSASRFIAIGSAVSGILALAGVSFGYFLGLPAAMSFLLHQFVTVQIRPMLTIQSYMSFVMVYMLGSAMLFQLPLIMIFINRIKPLKPSKLFKYERWVILLAFVMSGIMNPTPNLLAQLIVAGPIILMYQVGIGIIAVLNRKRRPARVETLLEKDRTIQAERLARLDDMRTVWHQATTIGDGSPASLHSAKKHVPGHKPMPLPAASTFVATPLVTNLGQTPLQSKMQSPLSSGRPHKYVDGFINMRPNNLGRLS
jgi:sec-independent protein translocase protein TatC